MFQGDSPELQFPFPGGSRATSRGASGGPASPTVLGCHQSVGIFSPHFPNCVDVELVLEAPGTAAIHGLLGKPWLPPTP